VVCSGVPRGKQNSYALVTERAPDAVQMDPDEALAELTRRYFVSHGPATSKDFRWWSSLTAAAAKRGLEMLAGELEREEVGKVEFWRGREEPPPPAREMPAAHLLQGYDEYIVGYTESRHVLDIAGLARAVPGTIPFYHAVIVDGQVVGHWRRQLRGGEMVVEMRLLRELEGDERAQVERAVERYAAFAGLPARLRV
jgi:hypothetical protein